MKKILLILVIILIVGGIFSWFLIKKISPFVAKQNPQKKASNSALPNYNRQLNNEIKVTFSSKYQDITTDTNEASNETNPTKQYQQYKLVFDKIAKAYQETKNPDYRFSLIQLKSYLRALPQYNEAELKIPQ